MSPLTLDTIVPAALLAVFVVLGFLAIFILLFITFYLYNRKCDLQQDMLNGQAKLERSLEEKEQRINEPRSVNDFLQAHESISDIGQSKSSASDFGLSVIYLMDFLIIQLPCTLLKSAMAIRFTFLLVSCKATDLLGSLLEKL